MQPISLAIADDHTPFREGLMSLFTKTANINVVFDAANGVEVLAKLKVQNPSVLLLDLEMDVMDGQEAFDLIKEKYSSIKVIIFTSHFYEPFITHFIKRGAASILPKSTCFTSLCAAIESVHKNGIYVNEKVATCLAKALVNNESAVNKNFDKEALNLNLQEIQVLKLMCKGHSTNEIAELLHRSPRTIDYNRNSIWHKTNIASKAIPDLTTFALKHKLLNLI